ncbi:MAG: NGG1p interacting factor NIF3 [Candidatus Omnitrophica bacterium]|nr:NGG1p interacting factor NIF3 [Candidatus Omnitrophota bacterium]
MKLGNLYKRIIGIGMRNDPRSRRGAEKVLRKSKKEYRSLRGARKAAFDKDSLVNPYSDTRILYGDKDKDINTIMVGIDIETPELLMADRFNQTDRRVDLVMSHHPGGRALCELHKVMGLQTDQLKSLGISGETADEFMGERIAEVARKLHSRNCMRNIDAARMLDIPFMCVHTAADNMVTSFLQNLLDKKKPKTLGAIVDILEGIYEYKEGASAGAGPEMLIGDRKRPAGRIFVDMTGGTEGSKRAFSRLSQIGIGTIISMHLSEEHYKAAKKEHINIIIAGHIASDNVGLNLILDELVKIEGFNIIQCSGFRRFSRI